MATTRILLELSEEEAQQLYFLMCDALEDFWEENDATDLSDIAYNNSIRKIRASLAPYVRLLDEADDPQYLRGLFSGEIDDDPDSFST